MIKYLNYTHIRDEWGKYDQSSTFDNIVGHPKILT